MALPIRDTPVLTGEDARRFLEQIKANENKKASPEEMARMKSNYEKMREIIKKSEKSL